MIPSAPADVTPSNPSTPHPSSSLFCSLCDRQFSRKCDLTRHMNRHSRYPAAHLSQLYTAAQLDASFTCPHCSSQFAKQVGLTQHLRHRHPAECNDAKRALGPLHFPTNGHPWKMRLYLHLAAPALSRTLPTQNSLWRPPKSTSPNAQLKPSNAV